MVGEICKLLAVCSWLGCGFVLLDTKPSVDIQYLYWTLPGQSSALLIFFMITILLSNIGTNTRNAMETHST